MAATKKAAPAPAPEQKRTTTELSLEQAPQSEEAKALLVQAKRMKVTNQASHTRALEFIQAGKALDRMIEAHYKNIKKGIDTLKNSVLTMERQDRGPVQEAVRLASDTALAYENAEADRVRREQEEIRRAAEVKAAAERARELAEQDKRLQELEESSPNLSAGELWFVTQVFDQGIDLDAVTATDLPKLKAIAKAAGYADPAARVEKFLKSAKIREALEAKRQAKDVADQQRALREQPLDVVVSKTVDSALGKVGGVSTRTTYSCEEVADVEALIAAWVEGKVPREAFMPNMVFLNAQARALKEMFPQAYPGCRLKKSQTIAG